MKVEILELLIPDFLLSALINSDESGLSDDESAALDRFTANMMREHGSCRAMMPDDCEASFTGTHDIPGILACDCVRVPFDVTKGA